MDPAVELDVREEPREPRRCLVIVPEDLAGLIRSLPALEALAAAGRRPVVLVPPQGVALLRLAPAPLEPLPRFGDLATDVMILRGAGVDEAVLLTRRPRDAWLLRRAGISPRWGYGRLPGRLLGRLLPGGAFLDHPVPPPRLAQRRGTDRRATADPRVLLDAFGAALAADAVPRLEIDDALSARAAERLARARLPLGEGPILGVYPGVLGGGGEDPWPRKRFDELLRRLRRRHPGARCVVLARTEDLWRSVRVYEETGKIHPVIGPDLKLDVLTAVLAALDLVVAADSWLLWLAAAAGTPTVGLYARDPARWAPADHLTLEGESPAKGRWSRGRGRVLATIGVDAVVDAVERSGALAKGALVTP